MVETTILGVSGLRGGVGTTSITALLVDALSHMDRTVLVVDLNDSDLLRLHFDGAYTARQGWGATFWKGAHWQDQLLTIDKNILMLPYGRQETNTARITAQVINSIVAMIVADIKENKTSFQPDWIVFDFPSHQGIIREALSFCDLHLLVCEADFAAHVLLEQYQFAEHTHLLLNKLNPKEPFGSDISFDWQERYRKHLVPVQFLWDARIAESLAYKRTALKHEPECETAQYAYELAQWCLTYPDIP